MIRATTGRKKPKTIKPPRRTTAVSLLAQVADGVRTLGEAQEQWQADILAELKLLRAEVDAMRKELMGQETEEHGHDNTGG